MTPNPLLSVVFDSVENDYIIQCGSSWYLCGQSHFDHAAGPPVNPEAILYSILKKLQAGELTITDRT